MYLFINNGNDIFVVCKIKEGLTSTVKPSF